MKATMANPQVRVLWLAGVASLLACSAASAHHSYAMFDMNHSAVLQGSVAKVEWTNPHVFVWMYVPKADKQGEYDLYALESGPINMLVRLGWNKSSLKVGEKLNVLYFPLRDGSKGGYFIKGVRIDKSELAGDPHAPGVQRELDRGAALAAPRP
jgi:Family of unknown function (DUF6152)